MKNEHVTPEQEQQRQVVAVGSFTDSIGSAGWGALEIIANDQHPDERQMYAAGLAEGYLTHKRIRQLYINDVSLRSEDSLVGLYKYFELQDRYLRGHAKKGKDYVKDQSMYWHHVTLEMSQLDGLTDGYNYAAKEKDQLVLGDMWLLNMDGDVIDLERGISADLINIADDATSGGTEQLDDLLGINLLRGGGGGGGGGPVSPRQSFLERKTTKKKKKKRSNDDDRNHGYPRYSHENWDRLMRHGRCSALIKVLPDFSDVFVGHSTWADYSELLRIWKTYTLPLKNVPSKIVSFSSYAGMISSTDDWYITDQELLITETTTQVEDEGTLRLIDPRTQVVSWVRTMVANRLASSGKEWSVNYVKGNSGTYNCQWMVLDYKMFEKGTRPNAGFYTMTEIIPGFQRSEDMTETLLKRGEKKCHGAEEGAASGGDDSDSCMENHMYWPSVNRPYWPDVRLRAGYPIENEMAINNPYFSFESNPRGRVFARDQEHIQTLHDMMEMMAYNDPNDSVQEDPGHGIASRYDLPGEIKKSGTLIIIILFFFFLLYSMKHCVTKQVLIVQLLFFSMYSPIIVYYLFIYFFFF